MDMYERPNILKQKNAFPPNFIHSLDSSHMMLKIELDGSITIKSIEKSKEFANSEKCVSIIK